VSVFPAFVDTGLLSAPHHHRLEAAYAGAVPAESQISTPAIVAAGIDVCEIAVPFDVDADPVP
jgi:hypothetical protein